MDVTFAYDSEVGDHVDGGRAQRVVVGVGECLLRRDDDGVSGVYTERVEVLGG